MIVIPLRASAHVPATGRKFKRGKGMSRKNAPSLRIRLAAAATAVALVVSMQPAVAAEEDPNADLTAEAARLNAQAGVATAEAAKINAQAARDKARVDALGLPSFEGKTTINTGALAVESWMLASSAVNAAARQIRSGVSDAQGDRKVILLAGDEPLDFGLLGAIETEVKALAQQLESACQQDGKTCLASETVTNSPAMISAVIGAAAGLLRQNTELSGIDVSLNSRVLAAAVASKMAGKGIIPTAATAFDETTAGTNSVLTNFFRLVTTATSARQVRDNLAGVKKPSQKQKNALAALNTALTRYDAFYTKMTSAESSGVVPLANAARLRQLLDGRPLVLRVDVEKAGGSVVKRENLFTLLGADPVAISGGLVASYRLTDPYTGVVSAAGMVTCRTASMRLRHVQDATWKPKPKAGETAKAGRAICEAQAS